MELPVLARGRYQLVNTLGQGGMACVFKAMDTRLKVEKAIKIPNHMCLTNKKIRDRFENEATTMAMLHHQNIVVVHDIADEMYTDPSGYASINLVYMVMEMLPGGSLQDRIEDHGPLHPQQAIDAAIAMASGLGFAHENGVVHRDVKLDNVLIGPNNELKVTDFGIAQIDGGSGMTQTGATMGTLAYMAPEQKLSSRRATAISDLYSVGASLYVMLTGKNPSELYAHDIQEVVFKNLPSETAAFLEKCCHLNPSERYQSASELIDALNELRKVYGPQPEDTLPFYVPRKEVEQAPEDIQRQNRKVQNMWTTLLGVDRDELSATMPHPRVVTPQNSNETALEFDLMGEAQEIEQTNDTAIDFLGLDLTGEHQAPVESAPTTVAQPTSPTSTLTQESSSSKTPLVLGLSALLLGGIGFGIWSSQSAKTVPTPVENTVQIAPKKSDMAAKSSEKEVSNPEPNKTEELENSQEPVANATQEEPKAVVEKPKTGTKNAKPKKTTKPVQKVKPAPKPVQPEVKEESKKEITPAKVPASNTFGEIVVVARPWSTILVNGKTAACINKSSNRTPCQLKLPTGRNEISLTNGVDGTTKKMYVNIKEGKNSNSCWSFTSNSPC